MKLKIRKIKEEESLNEKPAHLVDLKISKNQKENQSTNEQTGSTKWQKKIERKKNTPSSLKYPMILFQKISNEFAQSKKALFFYGKKFSILKKKKITSLNNFYFTKTSHLIKFISISIKDQYHAILLMLRTVISTLNKKTRKQKNTKTQEHKNTRTQEHKNTRTLNQIKLIFNGFGKFITNFQMSIFIRQLVRRWNNKPDKYLPSIKFFPIKSSEAGVKQFNRVHPVKSLLFNRVKPILIFILIAFVFILSLHILFLTQKNKNTEYRVSEKEVNIFKFTPLDNKHQAGLTPLDNKYLMELTNNIKLSDFIANQSKFNQIIKLLPANLKNRALLKAEKNLSEARENLIAILDNKEIKNKILTEQIINFQNNLLIALPKIQLANFYLTQINIRTIRQLTDQNEFNQIKTYFSKLDNNIQKLLDYSKILLQILGNKKKQRYLIVFQNDNKIRPTGGLIENFILVDINHGVIKRVETQHCCVSTEQQQNPTQPPYPLNLINSTWQAQDANWFFDFPTSAQKIIWFYKKLIHSLMDQKIDGVISLNSSLIPEILKITGPIKMSEYSIMVNNENFLTINKILCRDAESCVSTTSNFITDFIPELLNKILFIQNNSEQSLKILEILNEALSKKDMMFYFNNPDLQKNILKNNWAGEVKSINNGDYLAVINADINGKSNENIKQLVDLEAQILDDGTIINTVKITRTSFENEFTNLKNLNYIKIYVPKGSTLLEIKGFKKNPMPLLKTFSEEYLMDEDLLKIQKQTLIDEATNTRIGQEFNKTVFSNWVEVEPKKSATIAFKYKLPFKLEDLKTSQTSQKFLQNFYKKIAKKFDLINETLPYQLLIQKQSGKKNEIWKYSINLPIDWQLVWQNFSHDFIEKNGQIKFTSFLNQDQLWSMLLKKITD
ncbi:DUF4012 domain-containing protein [Candidatus Kuenenbacteria bacterium]|nr:DUF4012 domain-containing protein [Candidatus Kuenenbacteria bacterium]